MTYQKISKSFQKFNVISKITNQNKNQKRPIKNKNDLSKNLNKISKIISMLNFINFLFLKFYQLAMIKSLN